ncbi:MAG: DUF6578 domain-containing protein [Acidimicrobiia bacterium]
MSRRSARTEPSGSDLPIGALLASSATSSHHCSVGVKRVWLEGWAIQCCGAPFAVGAESSWQLRRVTGSPACAEFLPEKLASRVTDELVHHEGRNGPGRFVTGTVRFINAVYCQRVADINSSLMRPVAGSGRLIPVSSVDRWEQDPEEVGLGDSYRFEGYLVDLLTDRWNG